jgi:hypothetical protein
MALNEDITLVNSCMSMNHINNHYSKLIVLIDDARSIVLLYFADFEATKSLASVMQSYKS